MTVDKSMQGAARVPRDGPQDSARTGARATARKDPRKVRQRASTKKTTTTPARKPAKRSGRTTRTADEPATTGVRSESGRGVESEPARASAAAPPVEPGMDDAASAADAPRPPAPLHPGATMEPGQEQTGGLGGMLALWGPLIIVGFLVLVFRGADEREGDATAGAGASAAESGSRAVQMDGAGDPLSVAEPFGPASGRTGTGFELGGGRDGSRYARGDTLQASIAARPDFAHRGPATTMAASIPRGAYPPPPGPYRSPWARTPPADGRWVAPEPREWGWQAERHGADPYLRAREAPVQWVRCAPPYYWCPAPRSPSW